MVAAGGAPAMATEPTRRGPATGWTRRAIIPGLVLAVGVGLSLLAYWEARRVDNDRVHGAFELRANFRSEEFTASLNDVAVPIEALADFIGTQKELDPDEFYAMAVRARGNDPVARIAWAPLVRDDARLDFEAKANRDGGATGYAISDAGPDRMLVSAPRRIEYLPALYEQRFDELNSLQGLDWLARPEFKNSITKARETGEPLAVVLDHPLVGSLPRFFVLWPVYNGPHNPATNGERTTSFTGFVVGSFQVADVLGFAMQRYSKSLATVSAFVDHRPGDSFGVPLAIGRPDEKNAETGTQALADVDSNGIRLVDSLSAFGRNWTLVLDYPPDVVAPLRSAAPLRYLALGLVLTLMLTGITIREQRRRTIVESMVEERTRELQHTTAQMTAWFDASPVAIGVVDTERKVLSWNPAAEEMFGYRADEAIGNFYPALPPESEAASQETLRRLATDEVLRGFEIVQRTKDGRLIDTLASAKLIRDAAGKPHRIVFAVQDVTERKRADEELRQARMLRDLVVQNIPESVYIKEIRELRFILCNPAGEKHLGFAAQELIGKNDYDLHPRETAELFEATERKVLASRRIFTVEQEFTNRLGELHVVRSHKIPLLDAIGNPQYLLGVAEDITEMRQREMAERHLSARLRGIVETAPDGVVVIDSDGTIVTFNPAAERIFGYSADEVLGRNVGMLAASPDAEKHDGYIERYLRTKDPHIIGIGRDVVGRRNDGTTFPMRLAVGEIFQDGPPLFVGSIQDLTGQRAAEAKTRQTEALLAGVVEASEEAIISKNLDGVVTSWNKSAERIFGYSAEEIMGKHISVIAAPGRENEMSEILARIKKGERVGHHETQRRRKDGKVVDISLTVSPILDGQGTIIGASKMANDITAAKVAETALRESEEQYRITFASAPIGIAHVDKDGRITLVNDTYCRFLGRAHDDVVGARFYDFTHPDDQETTREAANRVRKGEASTASVEKRYLRPDGSFTYCHLTMTRKGVSDEMQDLLVVADDITARKAADKKQMELERQLVQAQKMEAVGQLTGGVAHDFNNLLMVILGNLELIEERIGTDATLRRWLSAATEAGKSGADLTYRLLAFSRRQTLEPEVTDVNAHIARFVPLITRTIGEAIELRQKLAGSVWPVTIDPGQFDNAILNLCVNARDAMPGGGWIEIATEDVTVDEAYAAQHLDLKTGDYVRVSVADSGHGMPPEVLARVFEPFYTTKETGKGTGLGLSMVYGFIKQSGGNVTIYSEVGTGTVVRLLLPRATVLPGAADDISGSGPTAEVGGELVLVVEDDAKVRAVTAAFLDGLGYRTLETGSAREALILIQDNPDIDLLLTDVVLAGGETGPKLAEEAKRIRPSLKVLFASGYTEDALARNGKLDHDVMLLRKPFTKSALSTKVREALDRPAESER